MLATSLSSRCLFNDSLINIADLLLSFIIYLLDYYIKIFACAFHGYIQSSQIFKVKQLL